MKSLCPTSWTVRTAPFQVVVEDYVLLQQSMEEISDTTDDEYGKKVNGIASCLEKFDSVFGLQLGYTLFGAAEQLSKTLQGKDTTVQEAITAVTLAKSHYARLRLEAEFDRFYKSCVDFANGKTSEPVLPRYRRPPARLDDGSAPHRHGSPKDHYRTQYYEACDLIQTALDIRFNQEKLKPVANVEKLVLAAANTQDFSEHLTGLQASCYRADLDIDRLRHQLHMVTEVINQALPIVKRVANVRTVCDAMNANPVTKVLLGELLRLYLTVLVTSATSERTFSARRRLNNYMRSTMRQDRLNTDTIESEEIAKSFMSVNEQRKPFFGRYL